jgi:dTDP-glucose 4,6-dehydratase
MDHRPMGREEREGGMHQGAADGATATIQRAVAAVGRDLPELESLRGTRLLLTGGTGFIGTWLLEHLAHLNERWVEPCRVYIPTRQPDAFAARAPHLWRRPEFTFITGDVQVFALPDAPCDYIIHAAGSASPHLKVQQPVEVGETIVAGTRRMLDVAREWGTRRMLFLSSGAVYGTQPPALERVSEDYAGGPDLSLPSSTYAEGKRYAESLCAAYAAAHSVPVCIARPFTFAAPYLDLDAGFALSDFLRDALHGQPLHILGDGSTVRSYAGATDMLRMLWAVLLRGQPGRAFNVGSESPVSVLELAQEVVRALGHPLAIEVTQQPVPGRLPERYLPDLARLRQEVSVQPISELADLVRETLEWTQAVAGERSQAADLPRGR